MEMDQFRAPTRNVGIYFKNRFLTSPLTCVKNVTQLRSRKQHNININQNPIFSQELEMRKQLKSINLPETEGL